MLQYYTCMQYTVIQEIHTYIHTNESKHSEMGSARQNPIQRPLRSLFICVSIALCTIVAHNIAQNRPDNFRAYPPVNHHCSDDVYLREGGTTVENDVVMRIAGFVAGDMAIGDRHGFGAP